MKLNFVKQKNKFLKALVCFDALLLLVFILTLMPFSKRSVSKSSKSALLNVNKVSNIFRIVISQTGGDGVKYSVELKKVGSFWVGTDSFTNTTWPADNQNIANLIDRCSQIVTVHTVASSSKTWKSFGVDDSGATFLGFYGQKDDSISEILFGNSDPLKSRVAFRTASGESVFQMDSSICSYISTSSSFWSDPFVYPQSLTGYSRMKSESILRHGALVSFSDSNRKHDFSFRKDFENGASARFLIYKNSGETDGTYTIVPRFIPGPATNEIEKKAIEEFDYTYNMSQWTLEKFSEEVQQQW